MLKYPPDDEYKSTQHHVDWNGEEIGQLQIIPHHTGRGFIAVAAVVHDRVGKVTLQKWKKIKKYVLKEI